MFKKLVLVCVLVLSSAVSFAGESIDISIDCVIEGHGGGCYAEGITLQEVPTAVSFKARITEESCYEDDFCDFCTSTVISSIESSAVSYLKVNVEKESNSLEVTEGVNDIKINFYDVKGSYITTQFLTVNASVNMTY